MRHFEISVDIAAPADRTWEVMSDIDHWHEWTPSITSIRRLGGVPFALGTRAIVRQPKFPPALWKITMIEPRKSFTWVSAVPGLLRVVGKHQVDPTPAGSRARLSLDLHGLLGGLFGQLTRGITERYIAYEAAGLKARSENPAYRHAGLAARSE